MSIETDYATLRSVLHAHEPEGWAVEFGVYSGYSLNIIASHMPVIGFDSFEGLPEDWREGFGKGKFNLSRPPQTPFRSMLVPGLFEDTAPDFPFPKLGLVHIDCDLYSSTATALKAVTRHVGVDTILVFDEFHSYPGYEEHEYKALNEWREAYNVSLDLLAEGSGPNAQEAAFKIVGMW